MVGMVGNLYASLSVKMLRCFEKRSRSILQYSGISRSGIHKALLSTPTEKEKE
jgi:hypothetical protein